MEASKCKWRHAPEARGGFWEILKNQRVENWTLNETVDFRLLTETIVAGATHVGGGADEKARIERLCLSPYVKEPLNSKVIKRFVPGKKKLLGVFRISRFLCSMYVCNEHPMYISHIHVYGYGTYLIMINIHLHADIRSIGSISLGHSGTGSNGNKWMTPYLQSCRTGVSSPDAVFWYI